MACLLKASQHTLYANNRRKATQKNPAANLLAVRKEATGLHACSLIYCNHRLARPSPGPSTRKDFA